MNTSYMYSAPVGICIRVYGRSLPMQYYMYIKIGRSSFMLLAPTVQTLKCSSINGYKHPLNDCMYI